MFTFFEWIFHLENLLLDHGLLSQNIDRGRGLAARRDYPGSLRVSALSSLRYSCGFKALLNRTLNSYWYSFFSLFLIFLILVRTEILNRVRRI